MSNTHKPKLLGVAASLRNARWGIGNKEVEVHKISYKPVGYILSTNKDVEDERLKKRNKLVDSRQEYLVKESHDRLITI